MLKNQHFCPTFRSIRPNIDEFLPLMNLNYKIPTLKRVRVLRDLELKNFYQSLVGFSPGQARGVGRFSIIG